MQLRFALVLLGFSPLITAHHDEGKLPTVDLGYEIHQAIYYDVSMESMATDTFLANS
jgi:hypothetical protein